MLPRQNADECTVSQLRQWLESPQAIPLSLTRTRTLKVTGVVVTWLSSQNITNEFIQIKSPEQ